MPHCIKEQEVLHAYGAPHPTKRGPVFRWWDRCTGAMPYPQRCSPLRNVVFHIGAFRHNIIRLTARVADKSIVLARITC